MKISTRGRYGLRAILDLAVHQKDKTCVSLSDIAQRQDLSFNYLEGIFAYLKRAGLVIGMAGSMGGYSLARAPEDITILEILSALEGNLSVTDLPTEDESDIRQFLRKHMWEVMDSRIENIFKNLPVADLVACSSCKKTS